MDVVNEKLEPWSYSRLHGFEDCPRRWYETEILKKWPKEETPQLKWGNDAHAALAKALQGEPLPTRFQILQKWVNKVQQAPGELLVEDDCRWAITKHFLPTTWFSKTVWLRCVADAVKLNGDVATVVDWKAGKSDNVDPVQLLLTSLMMFVQFPQLQYIRGDFIWLQEDHITQQGLYRFECADAWANILPRVHKFHRAMAAKEFPPTPNRFCKRYCPVKTCEFNGK